MKKALRRVIAPALAACSLALTLAPASALTIGPAWTQISFLGCPGNVWCSSRFD